MSEHLIAEANRHAKALRKMSLPTTQPTQRDIQWYIEECIDLRKQLDRECASKREHLRIACDEINKLKVQVGIYERENDALRNEAKYHDEADALRKLRERERDEARVENARLQNELARLSGQTQWQCTCGGTDSKGQRENLRLLSVLSRIRNVVDHSPDMSQATRLEWVGKYLDDALGKEGP